MLYFILTGDTPFEDMSTKEGIQKVVDGGRSEVTDEKILSSTHPYEKAMLKALDM